MKKILYTFLVAALILVSAPKVHATSDIYYTNNEGLSMTEKQYNNLLNQGFTEKQIERMDYTTFENNKDIEAQIVAMDKKYVKTTTIMRNGIEFHTSEILTEDEMLEEVQAAKEQPPYSPRFVPGTYYNGNAYNDYKAIQTVIVNLDDYTMRYKLDTYWYIMPSTRSYDIMGIGIEASKVQINSGISFREDWWTTSNTTGYTTANYPKFENTGGSVLFPLPSGSLDSLEQYMYFTVDKKPGVSTVTTLTATGDYAHATASVTNDAYNYMSVNYINGIEIDNPYANSFDEMNEAVANFAGTW
jgi:hypothetical protein